MVVTLCTRPAGVDDEVDCVGAADADLEELARLGWSR
jgi:hypothetical protein